LTKAFFHCACSIDAGDDALRSEDLGIDCFSRLDAQKELLLGPLRSTVEQHCNNLDELLLYTLGKETCDKPNVAIIVTARGRASVAVPPTCSAIEFYSSLRDLSTTGGEANFAGALGLASLLARKAESPRIIGFIAGDLNSSSLSPLNSNKEAKSWAATLSSRIESLPFKGSELTLISFASPLELGTATVHSIESSLGKGKIQWIHSNGNKESYGDDGSSDNLTQFFMDLRLSIGDEAGIPSFIASKTTPEQKSLHVPTPSVLMDTPTPAVAARKNNFQKSGLLQRTSFTCRDACLDVLLHHSRSGLLRSKLPTYSTLAYKASQDQSGTNDNGNLSGSGGLGSFLSSPQGCYIRIMPQPKYRTLLTLKGALMMSRAGYETAPLQIATKVAAMTATITRQLVQPTLTSGNTKDTPSLERGRSRPRRLGRGPLGTIKILQNMNHPEMLLLTWMSSGKSQSSSSEEKKSSKPSCNGNNDNGVSSSSLGDASAAVNGISATDTSYRTPEPFNMFSSRPPVTLASIVQSLRGGGGGGSGSAHARKGGIETALQNPFEHDGWEYWAQGQPVPFDYMTVLTPPAASANSYSSASFVAPGSGSGSGGVTVVDKTLEIVAGVNNRNIGNGGSNVKVYEKGYSLLFNTPQISTSITASISPSFGTGTENVGGGGGGNCAGMTSCGVIPPIWIPTGTVTEAPAEQEEEAEVPAPGISFERKLGSRQKAPGSAILVHKKKTTRTGSPIAADATPSIFISILRNAVFIPTFMVFLTLQVVQMLLNFFRNRGKQAFRIVSTRASTEDLHPASTMQVQIEERKLALENVQETSPPARHIPSFFPSLKYPLSEDSLVHLKNSQHLENELSSLMTSPPWVSITDVVQSIRDAVASNNSTISTTGDGRQNANRTNKEITSVAHPGAIILGPLDPAAVSYLINQQQEQQQVRSSADGETKSAVEDYRQASSLQQQQQQVQQQQETTVAASDTTTFRKAITIKAGLIAVADAAAKSDSSRSGDYSKPIEIASTSHSIDIPLINGSKNRRSRKIAITTGGSDSAASGAVAVTMNGRQLPLSASPSTTCLDIDATERAVPREASLPVPIPCSNTFVEQEGENEEEVKLPLTPPGSVTATVVAGARASGLGGSGPPPNPDTAE